MYQLVVMHTGDLFKIHFNFNNILIFYGLCNFQRILWPANQLSRNEYLESRLYPSVFIELSC